MKNIKAMGIAFIMFLVTITGVGIATKNGIPAYNIAPQNLGAMTE